MSSEQLAALTNFVRLLATAISTSLLYDEKHPQIGRLAQEAYRGLQATLAGSKEISLMLVEEELVFSGTPLSSSLSTNRLIEALKARDIGHLKILSGITPDEISTLASLLSGPPGAEDETRGTPHIRFGKVEIRHTQEDRKKDSNETLTLAEIPAAELARFMEIHEGIKKKKKLSVAGISEIVSGFVDAFSRRADPFMALAPLRAMDEYTFTHSTNVCILNIAQATALGIEGQLLHDIGISAMLHDVGKLFVPEEILNKKGKLDEAEWELMRQHPMRGAQYLLDTPGVPRLAIVTAFEHHMKFDGSGYPSVAKGWQQNLCSQMTAISDVFDALRTERSYKASVDLDKITPIFQNLAGKDLHPALTGNFLKILERLASSPPSQPQAP